jgi:hypothetical protein
MKVGDLVKAPWLMNHNGSVGLVIGFADRTPRSAVKVLFTNGLKIVFPHLIEVINESR